MAAILYRPHSVKPSIWRCYSKHPVKSTAVNDLKIGHPRIKFTATPYHQMSCSDLTHWGRVTHICVGNLAIISSDNGLSPGRHQAIIWTNAGILLIGPFRTNFSEILIEFLTFSFKKMCLKLSSAKWRSFFLGLNGLTNWWSTRSVVPMMSTRACHNESKVPLSHELCTVKIITTINTGNILLTFNTITNGKRINEVVRC